MVLIKADKYKTFPRKTLTSQLDYIYTCNKGKYIIDSYHVIDAPIFSDHLPIISDIIYPIREILNHLLVVIQFTSNVEYC